MHDVYCAGLLLGRYDQYLQGTSNVVDLWFQALPFSERLGGFPFCCNYDLPREDSATTGACVDVKTFNVLFDEENQL